MAKPMDVPCRAVQQEEGTSGELVSIALLLDFYQELLTPRQAEVLTMHCNDDLSLAEIAQELSISRQAAHDAIHTGKTLLHRYEEKLGMAARFAKQRDMVAKAQEHIHKALKEQSTQQSRIQMEQAGMVLEKLLEQL